MKKIIINGGAPLEGEVFVSGSKNSALAIVAASLLCQNQVKLYNCPLIDDVKKLLDILIDLNVDVKIVDDYVEIDSSNLMNESIINEKVSKLRASYYLMGVYLSLFNKVEINMPGGCDLGSRPIDLHLKSFNKLNCQSVIDGDIVNIFSKQLKSNKIFLEIPSVGATVNIMLASVFTEGKTIIENAAKEPEIVDLAKFLNKMGAKIAGAGSCIITIEGVKKLNPAEYSIMYDRIEAGTYAILAASCGKDVDVINFDHKINNSLIAKFIECNVNFKLYDNRIKLLKSDNILPTIVKTSYYPGFPTDLQQVMLTFLTKANGMSIVTDTIYPKRFKNCQELLKLGARINLNGNTANIYGPNRLTGTEVEATDLRGGASLVLAGLTAEGQTTIINPQHIYRGYSQIVKKLQNINGKIRLIEQ